MWASLAHHPVTGDVIRGWWSDKDVHPRVLLDPDQTAVAYGEVWDDVEEDEVELARLIVDPSRRREGVGGRLVHGLLEVAEHRDRSACFLRVRTGNLGARALYRSVRFTEVDEVIANEWNESQPVPYVWMQRHPNALPPKPNSMPHAG